MQERILSRRILHFAEHQLYWECQETLHVESSSEPIQADTRLQSKLAMFHRITKDASTWRRLVQPYHALVTMWCIACLIWSKMKNALGVQMEMPAEAAMQRSWARIVGMYNTCHLQLETDKLPGILGLAREMAHMTGDVFCAGIWLNDISRGLYWSPRKDGQCYSALKKQPLANGMYAFFQARFIEVFFSNKISTILELGWLAWPNRHGGIRDRV